MMYLINPPMLNTNVPPFLMKFYLKQLVRKMAEWAVSEYHSAIAFYQERGDARTVRNIVNKHSERSVLSGHPDFKKLCQLLNNDDLWNSLSRWEQKMIAGAYAIK